MTNMPVPESYCMFSGSQGALLKDYRYEMPTVLEAIVGLSIYNKSVNCPDSNLAPKFSTRCQYLSGWNHHPVVALENCEVKFDTRPICNGVAYRDVGVIGVRKIS